MFGLDPVADPTAVLSRIGHVSDQADLPNWMRIGELLLQECQLGLVHSQLCLGLGNVLFSRTNHRQFESLLKLSELSFRLGDVFFARADYRQIQRLLIHRDLCIGHIQCGLGIVQFLLAHRAHIGLIFEANRGEIPGAVVFQAGPLG